jgi:hypothetical protein
MDVHWDIYPVYPIDTSPILVCNAILAFQQCSVPKAVDCTGMRVFRLHAMTRLGLFLKEFLHPETQRFSSQRNEAQLFNPICQSSR